MCDFLVVSSERKFRICNYLSEVVRRRRKLSENEHGWGMFFDDGEYRVVVKEPIPAWRSTLFLWLEKEEIETEANLLLLHVRKATRGAPSWHNTHPFYLQVNGKLYVFAHKGDVSSKMDEFRYLYGDPLGETDSERFFLAAVRVIEENGGLPDALDELKEFSDKIGEGSRLNYFLYDGEYLVVYDGRDSEPLYYREGNGIFIAASEEFRTDKMGEVGVRRIFLVRGGRVLQKLES